MSKGSNGKDRKIDKKVGKNVRTHREKKRLTQGELGRSVGVKYQMVQKYEKGKTSLTIPRLVGICKTLGVTPNDLIDESDYR